jgi:E3 ubiquitin-protein ligase BRE1
MSDKRGIEAAERSPATDNKRQKLDELSESGPLTQRDVVYFQKEAIYRQMVQYKAKSSLLEKEVLQYSKDYESYKAKVLILNGWTDQVISYLKSLSSDEQGSEGADILAEGQLLDVDETDDQLNASLNEKRSILNSLLGKLTSSLPTDVSESLNSLTKERGELKISQKNLLAKNDLLQRNYEDVNEKYLQILKQSERLNSSTIERINEIRQNKSENKDESPIENKGKNENNLTANQSSEIESLTLEISQQKSFIQTQENIINDQISKISKIQDELSHLTKTHSVNSTDVKSSADYQHLFKDYELLKNQHAEHSNKYDALLDNFQSLEKDSNHLKDVFNENFSEEKAKIINQFGTLEKDLIRIRTARDELLTKVSILEVEKSQSSTISELQKHLDSQAGILESLDFKDIKAEPVESNNIESLQRTNSILTQELQSLENAFKSITSTNIKKFTNFLELEQSLNKYKIEKQKADQKYFAAMRSKDSLLLQLKNMKDLIKNYEIKISNLQDLKTVSQDEISTLSSNLANSNKLVELKQREIDQLTKRSSSLESKMKETSAKLDSLQSKYDQISKEKSSLGSTETSLKLANQKLLNQTESLSKQLDRYKSQSSEALNSEELEQYRSLIYCSLCSKNWKSTAITQCGHVFCDACTKERLDARMRKCPTCNKPFSYNDLLTVHL